MEGSYNVHLIYYDENIELNSENFLYMKQFKDKIKGIYFPVNNINSLVNLVNKLKKMEIKGKFTLVTSGSAAEKIIPICSQFINSIIIFCFYIDKYLPLKKKYPKIKNVVNDFSEVLNNLNQDKIDWNSESKIIGNKFITFENYTKYYIKLHKKLSDFFDEKYQNLSYKSSYKNSFINFIQSLDIDDKNNIIYFTERVTSGTVKEFIEVYTGETTLCYSLNRWLRNCIENEYEKIKYFAGPFSYALYKYAHDYSEHGIYKSKTFYRKMTIKLSDYYLYKLSVGELICYPAFTSTSEKDISKYNFPTSIAIEVNGLTLNDVSVVLIIKYNCISSSYPSPCVSATQYSVNSGEEEYIFPPFSFFRINSVEEKDGTPQNPHIIYMSTPNKRSLIEFELKKNKTINYNRKNDELYAE